MASEPNDAGAAGGPDDAGAAGDALEIEDDRADLRAEGVAIGSRRRSLLSSIALYAPIAYAGAVVLRDSPHGLVVRALMAALALLLARTLSSSIDELPDAIRASTRFALASGLTGALLSCGMPASEAGLPTIAAIASVIACALSASASLHAIEGIAGLGGLLQARPQPRRRLAYALGAAWAIAAGLEAARMFAVRAGASAGGPLDRASIEAGSAALDGLVLIATLSYVISARRRRRLELGALERHDLLLGAAALAMPVAIVLATSLDPFGAAPRSPLVLVAPSLAIVAGALVAQLVKDPVAATSLVARAWIALISGLVVWTVVEMWAPTTPGYVALFATAFGVGVGFSAAPIARALGLPDPYLEPVRLSISKARDAISATDTREVERGVLASLRVLAGAAAPSATATTIATPRLITFAPLREVVLDAAGEPRARELGPATEGARDPDAPSPVTDVVPRMLLSLLATEPLGIVRVEVLRSFEVRRPDLRPALSWCDRNDAAAVVALMTDGDLEGLLVVPNGKNLDAVGLTYARALRSIGRAIAPRIALETALARGAARTRKAEQRAREIDHLLERATDRERRLERALAGGAVPYADKIAVGGYAPASRALREGLDALGPAPVHLLLLHRPGTDPTPYAARLHRASARRGALHVVDAARGEQIEERRWADPIASPIELARDGTLLVRAAGRLPLELQRSLVRALAFHAGPGRDAAPLDFRLVAAIAVDDPETADEDALLAPIEPALAGRLHRPALRVARLAHRSADLRAIALDRLAVAGIALRGEPLGLSDEALLALVEHPWPGDDDELDVVLAGAAKRAVGRRVERDDVLACLPRG